MTGTLVAPSVRARLRPLYATGFIHGFALWYAVEKLFMKSIGFNDFLITIVTITYIVVMTMANIPLGVLADRWSRKGVLYLATCALIAGTLICGLSHGFWMTRFAADPSVLNKTLKINGQTLTVVGVAAPKFDGTTLGVKPQVYVPITLRAQMNPGWNAWSNRRTQ